jgi:hypothetical protein
MTLTLELPADLEARLKAEADRHGLPIAEYALTLLRATVSAPGGSRANRPVKPAPEGSYGRRTAGTAARRA